MTDNKALWRRAFTTDPAAVKAITGKQYSGNSPKPYWIIERLTDEFGPCGIGWGFTILSERFERFGEGKTAEALHIACVRFWYMLDGKRGELEQVGQTRASYTTSKDKFLVDEDAPKKSVTDALVKCASYLGFAGDIFSGRWDDSRYVEEAGREWTQRKMEDDPQRAAWLEARKADIFACTTVGSLKMVIAAAIETAASQNDSAAVDQLNEWAEEKKAQARPKVAA
jgi:hypothetical protein